jgi:hypothetical protein
VIHGLVHRRGAKLACYCPACYSRRWGTPAFHLKPASRRGLARYLKHSHFRAIDFVFGHLLSRRLDVLDEPFPDTVNI